MSVQGSDEWFMERLGHCTASEFGGVLAKPREKNGVAKTRAAYMRRILAERITGKPSETFENFHTRRGRMQEPLARAAYEVERGAIVEEVGFIRHPTIKMVGCSPDGFVGADGGVEAKCVIPHVQLDTVMGGKYPQEHIPQVQGNLWVTGRQWWDFVSYCPDFEKPELRLYVYRVERDEPYIKTLEHEVRRFLAETETIYRSLMGLPLLEAA